MFRCLILISFIILPLSGCHQPTNARASRFKLFDFGQKAAYGTQQASNNLNSGSLNSLEQNRQFSQLADQVQSLNQKLGAFDSDNQTLLTEIAGLKQKLQVTSDYNNQMKQQLGDNANQYRQMAVAKQAAEQQLANVKVRMGQMGQFASTTGGVPSQLAGAATMRANNSLMNKLSNVQIAGGSARMDGDVIRIEFPSDRMFAAGTYQISPSQSGMLGNLVATIRQHFPRQIIGIEAHWDGTPLNPPTTTPHQLTATQALSMFNTLRQLGLPSDQMFTMALGSNRPRHPKGVSNGVNRNRRIEVVIYPETYDGT